MIWETEKQGDEIDNMKYANRGSRERSQGARETDRDRDGWGEFVAKEWRLTTWFLGLRGVSPIYIHPVYKLPCTSVHSVPTPAVSFYHLAEYIFRKIELPHLGFVLTSPIISNSFNLYRHMKWMLDLWRDEKMCVEMLRITLVFGCSDHSPGIVCRSVRSCAINRFTLGFNTSSWSTRRVLYFKL